MMLRKTAVQYCDISDAQFGREVMDRRLPQPVLFGGKEHWHRASLDRALAVIAGEESVSRWRENSELHRRQHAA